MPEQDLMDIILAIKVLVFGIFGVKIVSCTSLLIQKEYTVNRG
jgi:hypothetical protein